MSAGAALSRRPADGVTAVANAVGARVPAYVTREQARAVSTAAAIPRDRLLFECLWQTGERATEVLRRRRPDPEAPIGVSREQRRLRTAAPSLNV